MAKPSGPKRSNPPSLVRTPEKQAAAASHGRALVALDQIDVSALRTRDVNERHVVALAESIGAMGLIHPPAVDRLNRLLAGAHRLAALRWLQSHANARFLELFPKGIVPVWRMELDATSDIDLALAVEISENEQRRDYSSAEILKLADRLRAAGFHYSAEGGRPKADARPLMPALESIVGKSVRQLRRVLNPTSPAKRIESSKTRPSDLVNELKAFRTASSNLIACLATAAAAPELFTLKAQLERTQRLTTSTLAALESPTATHTKPPSFIE